MEEIKRLLKIRKNLIGLIVVLVLLIALPVGIYLAQTTQIFKPRAFAPGSFILSVFGCQSQYTSPCSLDLGFASGLQISASATVSGQELNRIEVHVAEANSSGSPIGNFTEIIHYNCPDDFDLSNCFAPQITDSYSAADANKYWIYVMDVWYDRFDPDTDEYIDTQLWCGGLQNDSDVCSATSTKLVHVLPLLTPSPTTSQSGGGLMIIQGTRIRTDNDEPVANAVISVSGISGNCINSFFTTSGQSDGSYIFDSFTTGNSGIKLGQTCTVTTDLPAGYSSVYYTKCDNSTNCHSGAPSGQGTSVTFTTPTSGGFVDLWWHYTPASVPLNVTATLLTGSAACTGSSSNIRVDWDNITGAASYKIYEIDETESESPIIVPQFPSDYTYSASTPGEYAFTVKAYSGANASGTLLAESSASNGVVIPTGYCGGGTTPTPGGGIYPAPPGGIYPAPPIGGSSPTPGGVNPTSPPVTQAPQVSYACINNSCQAVTDSSGTYSSIAMCQSVCSSQPTQPPANCSNLTATAPNKYRVANASNIDGCGSALSGAISSNWPAGQLISPLISFTLSPSTPGPKTVCAQFYFDNCPLGSIMSKPITLISSTQATPTPTTTQVSTPTPPGSPTPTKTPTPSPTGVITTKEYKFAENLVALETAPWLPFKPPVVELTHSFSNKTPGTKQICVKFRATNNTESAPVCKSIELVKQPAIQACNITSSGDDTQLELLGENFGSVQGTAKSGAITLTVLEWSDKKVVVKYQSPVLNQSLPVTITSSDGIKAEGACSGISQLAIGAQLFCPQVKDIDIPNTEVTIVEAALSGKVFTEKATLKILKANNVGVIEGLKTKLQLGKPYKLSIKVPRGVRRVLKNTPGGFVASGKTTNVDFIKDGDGAKLPLGDIFPVGTGDGAINAADFTQLKKDIQAAKAATNSYSDLNLDNWVNSFEWACMRPEIGTSDENVPAAGPLIVPSD